MMEIINQAVQELKKGKVVVCPTDTVYGLIADATDKKAVEKIFKIKKRPKNKPIPIFVKDLEMAKKIAEIDDSQEKFLKKAWPGKITVVLKLKIKNYFKIKNLKFKIYGINRNTIALRIPKNKLVLRLLKKINRPLVGTSANVSDQPPSGNLKAVLRQFEGQKLQPDLIIDAGNLKKSKPSKVVDLTGKKLKILRK